MHHREDDIELYDIPPPNHSDYVLAIVPVLSWALASYLTWDEGVVQALFNGACCAIGTLVVIVLAQFLLGDPPSMLFRDAAGRIFDTPFGLWSARDPARCAAEDAAYNALEKHLKEDARKRKNRQK